MIVIDLKALADLLSPSSFRGYDLESVLSSRYKYN